MQVREIRRLVGGGAAAASWGVGYRDDHDALRARADGLERELAEVKAELAKVLQETGGALVERLRRELGAALELQKKTQRELDELRSAARVFDVAALRAEMSIARRELKQLRDQIATERAARSARLGVDAGPAQRAAGTAFDARKVWEAAKAAYDAGDLDQAEELCRELHEYGVEGRHLRRADVYLMLGRILLKKRGPTEAMEMFGRGLTLEPYHERLRRAMDEVSKR